jgi:hypothetical protein
MPKASDHTCVFLGCSANHLHHPTGRTVSGEYLDPELTVPIAHREHVNEHTLWRAVDIGEKSTMPDNLLRLLRLGHFLVRVGEHHDIGAVVLPAWTVREIGKALNRIATDMETGR